MRIFLVLLSAIVMGIMIPVGFFCSLIHAGFLAGADTFNKFSESLQKK